MTALKNHSMLRDEKSDRLHRKLIKEHKVEYAQNYAPIGHIFLLS